MKRHLISSLTVSALVTACALIAPQVFARAHAPLFEKFDENGDGKVTRTEAHNNVLERFRSADANKDKVVTQEEAKKHHEQKMKEHGNPEKFVEAQFKAHDKNNNGKLERSESRLPDEIFKRIDKNGDSAITKQEALAAHQARMAKKHEAKESRGKRHAEHKKHHGKMAGSFFSRIDTSGDGKITEAEAKGAADRAFSRFDQNKDNVITRAEVSQSQKGHRPVNCGEGHEKKHK